MKVLLASPSVPLHTILPERYRRRHKLWSWLGDEKPILGVQPPYGLLYLSAYLKRAGHEVSFRDGFFHDPAAMVEHLRREDIRVVGMTAVSYHWDKAVATATAIRQALPDTFIVVGGAHANALGAAALASAPVFDALVHGDGEETFVEIVDRLAQGTRDLSGIHGVITPEWTGPERAPIREIDDMPFADRSLIDLNDYRPSPFYYRKLPFTAIIGSRGCPYKCTFCHTEVLTRIRSPESLVDEIVHLQQQYGVREVVFYDDTFTLKKRRVVEFCELLLRRGVVISWSANARADSVTPELLRLMRRAGCWRLLFGIESGNQKTLDRMQKKETLGEIRHGIRITRESGIDTYGMFILGYPGESYEDGLRTIAFAQELELDYANFCAVTPFPGTALFREVKDEPGFLGYETMSMFDVSYVSPDITRAELQRLVAESARRFYLRPKYLLSRLSPSKLSDWEDVRRYGRGFAMVVNDFTMRV